MRFKLLRTWTNDFINDKLHTLSIPSNSFLVYSTVLNLRHNLSFGLTCTVNRCDRYVW